MARKIHCPIYIITDKEYSLIAIAAALSRTLRQCGYGLFIIVFIAFIVSLRKWPRQPISMRGTHMKSPNDPVQQQSASILASVPYDGVQQ